MKRELNVVLFSGGRGTQSISETLLRHPQVSLCVLINAYDDGLSTGVIRRFIPGMLGPSDVRKNLHRMMRATDDSDRALGAISDYRLPLDTTFEQGMRVFEALHAGHRPPDGFLGLQHLQLSVESAETLGRYCGAFLEHVVNEARRGNRFEFSDCAVGNVLFAGAFLSCGRDFNRTIDDLARVYKVRGRLLNVTLGENYYLVAEKTDGAFLLSEAAIVSDNQGSAIDRLYLLEEDLYRRTIECNHTGTPAELRQAITDAACLPGINPDAEAALRSADIIIYGPGTQHSSLFPSYMTVGIAEAIAANREADKLFLANIWRDFDIQCDDASSLARKFFQCMSRYGEVPCNCRDLVTHFFFQEPLRDSNETSRYITFDRDAFEYPLDQVKLVNWESPAGGKHVGGRVFAELHAIVQSRIDLARMHQEVSIIVPVLNEAKTIANVLTDLQALDFRQFDLGKEIVVVDGGSSDSTVEIARSFRGVAVIELPRGAGKGDAVRAGVAAAVGTVLVTFPGDGEYVADDLYSIIEAIVKNGYPVVFGSRVSKCINLDERIRGIYGKAPFAAFVSKYGGMVLSIITLLLYNKYVTDLLTSVKGFDSAALRGLNLTAKSFDIEAELTAKLAMKQNYLLELPVEYYPRTRAQGKKIRISDGFRCILELFRPKIFPNHAL